MNGIIARYNEQGGFGFIRPLCGKPESTADVFFHVSGVCQTLDGHKVALPTGCEVSFDLVRADRVNADDNPFQAANIRPVLLSGSVLQRVRETSGGRE